MINAGKADIKHWRWLDCRYQDHVYLPYDTPAGHETGYEVLTVSDGSPARQNP